MGRTIIPVFVFIFSTLAVCTSALYIVKVGRGRTDTVNPISGQSEDDWDNVYSLMNREDAALGGVNAWDLGSGHGQSDDGLRGLRKMQVGGDFDSGIKEEARHGGRHNLTEGAVDESSRVVFQRAVNEEARGRKVLENNFFFYGSRVNISCVEAIDLHTNSSQAGLAWILNGGVGHHFVFIHLKSQNWQSLKYLVRVWGFLNN